MIDGAGTISLWPDRAQQLYGWTPEEAMGREFAWLSADTEQTATPISDLPTESSDSPRHTEEWHERADGSTFWADCRHVPVGDEGREGFSLVVRDATERKRYEQTLERQNDRLEELAQVLVHDLRNPLSVIDGRLQLYRETSEPVHLDAIDQTLDRMARLIDDLLRAAQGGEIIEDVRPTDLAFVLATASEGALPASATVEYESIPTVMANPDRLIQVFENLFLNSADHGGEEVTVRVGPLANGFYLEDDGPGIPASTRDRVFEHGYTTRRDGSGYGLSIVRSVVGAHGWDVSVVDPTDSGARFEVTGVNFVDGT